MALAPIPRCARLLLLWLILLPMSFATASTPVSLASSASVQSTALEKQARAILHDILQQDSTWVGIHAAEMLAATGEAEFVRGFLTAKLDQSPSPLPRIGLWRTLALVARSREERLAWIGKIETVYLDPQAPDRKQAIESLAKLAHELTGRVREAATQQAQTEAAMNTILPWWSLANSGDARALPQLQLALRSTDSLARQRAAYALRWLKPTDATLLHALNAAAQIEPAGTLPRVFMISSALALNVDPAQAPAWKKELAAVLFAGPTAASYEAGQTLAKIASADELPAISSLLTHPDADTRVAAAYLILAILQRPTSPVAEKPPLFSLP